MTTTPILSISELSRYFGSSGISLFKKKNLIKAVKNISFAVDDGEVFGIIGESGSGKSTLGFLMAGLESPTSGDIQFKGQSISEFKRGEFKRFCQKVQVVFQDSGSALNPRRTIMKTLEDSLRLAGISSAERRNAAHDLLKQVGLGLNYSDRYPHQLSGGQRQRVGIARALAMRPEVLIADEPVSALDVSFQGQIINLLLKLREQLQLTIIFISHDIAVVNHACDRVAVMHQGSLVELGETSEIIQNPKQEYTKQLISAVPRGLIDICGDMG